MEDNMKKGELVVNEAPHPDGSYPPPYNPDTAGAPQQYPQQYLPQHPQAQPMQQPGAQYPPATTVVQNVPAPCPDEVFAREACYAHCVRFWWCRPIGWLAVAELDKARALYIAGDYDGAEQAARKANIWSTVGLVSGVLFVAGIGIATYFIVTSVINSY